MELPDRQSIEADFAARIAKLSARQRRELESWLNLTTPPDINNVPAWQWEKWEDDSREELLLILLLIGAASAELHGTIPGDRDVATALTGWAEEHAAEVARSMAETTREKIEAVFAAAAEEDAAAAFDIFEFTDDQPQSDFPSPEEAAARRSQRLRDELDDAFDSIFGDKRAENVAVTETTTAQSAGGEIGVGMTVGTSPDDTWFTVNDGKVCPICTPLHKTPRSYWARFFPAGPPGPHARCRCWIEYANVGKELVSQ